MEFIYLHVDTDIWFKAQMEKDGNQYYKYIIVCVDDIIIVDKDPHEFMSMLMQKYTFKPSSIVDPKL